MPANAEICFLDDSFYPDMTNDNIYYINVKPYVYDLKLEDIKNEFNNRFDEEMGIEGNKLSGGQRQIVWLLRAFFRKSCIS